MIKFGIKFEGDSYLKHYRTRQKVNTRVRSYAKLMPKYCAMEYTDQLRKNLMEERYRSAYTYNKKYLEWKQKVVGHDKSWQLFGDLLSALTFFRAGGGWMGGVPNGVMGQSGKSYGGRQARGKPGRHGKAREIAWYGTIVERRKPLFKPTARMYRKKGWKDRGKRTLEKIKQVWK